MTSRITFHGIACYELVSPRGRVLVDPFFAGNPAAVVGADDLEAPDVILASHAAFDHMGDAASVALRTGAPVVCGTDTAELLRESGVPDDQIRVTIWGIRVRFGDILVHPVECHHWSQARLADGRRVTGSPMGFIVDLEDDVRVYHFGDTAIFSDLELIGRLHAPTVGLLGCTQPWSLVAAGPGEVATGEMTPREAAMAAEMLGVRYAVATHYEDAGHPDVRRFLAAVPEEDGSGSRVALALEPGQTLVLEGSAHRLEER